MQDTANRFLYTRTRIPRCFKPDLQNELECRKIEVLKIYQARSMNLARFNC